MWLRGWKWRDWRRAKSMGRFRSGWLSWSIWVAMGSLPRFEAKNYNDNNCIHLAILFIFFLFSRIIIEDHLNDISWFFGVASRPAGYLRRGEVFDILYKYHSMKLQLVYFDFVSIGVCFWRRKTDFFNTCFEGYTNFLWVWGLLRKAEDLPPVGLFKWSAWLIRACIILAVEMGRGEGIVALMGAVHLEGYQRVKGSHCG